MDFVKIMWISDLLENLVLNGCFFFCFLFFVFFFFNFWVCVLRSGFVFLFNTHLDLNSYDFWFLIMFLIFNLDANVAFFNAKIKFFIIILIVLSTT